MEQLQVRLDDMAWRIATFGIERLEAEAKEIANVALGNGIALSAAQVLADSSEPAVARERAFARVAVALGRLNIQLAARFPAA